MSDLSDFLGLSMRWAGRRRWFFCAAHDGGRKVGALTSTTLQTRARASTVGDVRSRSIGVTLRRAVVAALGGFVVLVSAVGCSVLPERESINREWFLLTLPAPAGLDAAGVAEQTVEPQPSAIALGSVRVAPAYAGQGLVYRLGAHRVDRDFYNEWFLPPQEQVQALLGERWHPRLGVPRVRADVMVTDLYAALERPGEDAAIVGLRVLLRPLDANGQPIDSAGRLIEVRERESLAQRDAERVTAALSTAFERALRVVELAAENF
ncbi:MAG: hypothetical protein ACK4IT_10190 [Thioalkalivibrionaceae bacterium]